MEAPSLEVFREKNIENNVRKETGQEFHNW